MDDVKQKNSKSLNKNMLVINAGDTGDWDGYFVANQYQECTETHNFPFDVATVIPLRLGATRDRKETYLNVYVHTAYEDIIFKSTQDETLWKDVSGKEILLYSDFVADHDQLGLGLKKQMLTENHRKSTMLLTWNLFKLYLKNDHSVLSLFQRTCGMFR